MGDFISKFIPSWVPLAIIGVLLAAVIGGGFALKSAWQTEALQAQQIKQYKADKELSAKAIAERDAKITKTEAEVAAVRQRIANAPVTSSCGPVIRDTADGVRELLRQKP